jgi:tyrosinase
VDSGGSEWVYGVENYADSNAALQNPQWYSTQGDPTTHTGAIGELVYRMFTKDYFKSWETFASTKYYSEHPDTDYLSLEYIHNNIHVSCIVPSLGLQMAVLD